MGKYFGTDGIRGIALEKLNSELAYKLGQAISVVFGPKEVVIGYDTRESSPLLAYAIANGLNAKGVDVIFAGVVPTPMVANYSKVKQVIGIMITASHNPFTDNGIKVFNKGYKTQEDDEQKLEAFMDHGVLTHQKYGQFTYSNQIKIEYLKVIDTLDLKPTDLSIAYDSANGANYQIAHEIISKLSHKTMHIGNTPDGRNINLDCGSTSLSQMIEVMKSHTFDLGFSFDGDGDRIILLDSKGDIYDGDLIVYVIAKYLKAKNLLNNNQVVLTKMSNPGLLKALKNEGIDYLLTDVGDKHVFAALEANDLTIGGESSGHVILRHLLHTGDGLLVALYLIKILTESNLKLEEMIADVNIYPLVTTNLKDIDKNRLKDPMFQLEVQNLKNLYGDDALILVRASGTENLVRITVSHKDMNIVMHITDKIKSIF